MDHARPFYAAVNLRGARGEALPAVGAMQQAAIDVAIEFFTRPMQ